MIDAEVNEAIVVAEILVGRELHAHEQAEIFDRTDVGFHRTERAAALKAAIEVHERDT